MNPAAVAEATRRIAGRVRRTPVIEAEVDGRPVFLKLELLQYTGSFKPRGAFNRVLGEAEIPAAGVIAASGGNHGAALAYVAHELGIACEIFVAEVTPDIKRRNIARYGATITVGGPQYSDALAASLKRAASTGALEIHAYDHPATVAGQGTMAQELHEQVPDVGTVLMAAGGGGFIAGAAAWWEGRVDLVAVEPTGAPTVHAAIAAGKPVQVDVSSLAADSLGSKIVGEAPFDAIRRGVTHSVLVDDDDIRAAQRYLWDEFRLVAEPGGAAALAAFRNRAFTPTHDGATVVVVCGSNCDPQTVTG
ncbi:MAG TPA: threonine/serine dehydratase [Acidimicrobiales bacterium]|nr:threonine/serine dehydratase [Acidimicrobiales bacterium]